METSRGNLIERSKPRCVQFASINVSSLALWEHRGFKTEAAKGKDECPDEEEEEEGWRRRERSGRECNQSRAQSDELSFGMTTGHRRSLSSLIHPFQGSPLPTPSSTTLDNSPFSSPSHRSSLIGMEARANTYNIHQHLRRPRGGGGVVGVGTLLAAFPDSPHRRYQDCRPTDQCRERRRRLGVHRRLLKRTDGHGRTLENRLTALQDLT